MHLYKYIYAYGGVQWQIWRETHYAPKSGTLWEDAEGCSRWSREYSALSVISESWSRMDICVAWIFKRFTKKI